jgi:hypothetical protein
LAQVIGFQAVTRIHIQALCAPEVKAFDAHSTRNIKPAAGREEQHEKTGSNDSTGALGSVPGCLPVGVCRKPTDPYYREENKSGYYSPL